ncbi:hypothetical protein CK203_017824 [Vitis vinifera]|uniref:Uncharacterized protein n=1 Tax=Vitis vinifera TaxID=29760 RepID=A0A438JH27_VITVI|nr:hypothetical protein CK203_017824 [Vitis vinifera]
MKDGENSSKARTGESKTKETEHLISSFATCSGPSHSPSEGEAPSQRRYPTRRPPTDPVHPPTELRDLLLGPCQENQVLGSWRVIPCALGRAAYRGASDSCRDYPETLIRRPMIAGPPIEGNLDCRDRSFHSETYFDI